jgi:hypothetical protein
MAPQAPQDATSDELAATVAELELTVDALLTTTTALELCRVDRDTCQAREDYFAGWEWALIGGAVGLVVGAGVVGWSMAGR